MDDYQTPLGSRYASKAMRQLWSPRRKFQTWRRLWLALAEAEQELGLTQITDEALAELREHLDDIDLEAAGRYEKTLRHDVMAHVHALGDQAPAARPILHLGATSQFVNCNTELLQLRDGMRLLAGKTAAVICALSDFALRYRDVPTLGFTHYQPAQPTTVGKRATLWAYDLVLALEDIEHRLSTIRFRGVKGATGTQASFLDLFDNDHDRVEQLDQLVTSKMGFDPNKRYAVTGQTYPRLVDAHMLSSLACTAAAIHKMCTDLRLLANRKEIEEPFETSQIGSSAMPYKRNPMRCERATALSRFVMSLVDNPLNTAATQWLERTLDDSANRRMVLPEAFLGLDAALDIVHNVVSGLVVYERTVHANLMAELPFMATENVMMAATRQGVDRQTAHEVIRRHSQDAAHRVKSEGLSNDLLDRLRGESLFAKVDLDSIMDPAMYVGRAPQQVDEFLAQIVQPIRDRYESVETPELRV